MSKYGVFSGPYFSVFGLNAEKYGQEKTPYLDTFHAVCIHETIRFMSIIKKMKMEMKNRSHRYDINRPRSRHGHKYKKCKTRLTTMMLIPTPKQRFQLNS